jgi:hypothetical protein
VINIIIFAPENSITLVTKYLKMNTRLLALCVLLIVPFFSLAQTSYTLTGEVADSTGGPVVIGNALALSKTDSSLITGAVIMDGAFSIEGIKENDFLLCITSLGYVDIYQAVSVPTGATTHSIGKRVETQ